MPYTWLQPKSRAFDDLRALSYVSSTFDANADRMGVQLHDAERAFQGLNFYYSAFQTPVLLVDMDGTEVWRWEVDPAPNISHAELLPDGDVLVVRFDSEVLRVDAAGEVRWRAAVGAHHGVWVDGDELFVPTRRSVLIPAIHATQPTLEDRLTVLRLEDGEVLREVSFVDIVRRSPYAFLMAAVAANEYVADDGPLDVLHVNHVEVFDGSLAVVDPLFARGNLLVSMRHLNAIMILDGESHDVLWIWGPSNLYLQHHPQLLPDGRILLFDNGIVRSRVLEVNPLTRQVDWEYEDDELYSALRGSVQRLPNGNTLITESDTGYVFEVTRAGETVWEFANPEVGAGGERSVIWRMTRHRAADLSFLDR